MQVRSMTLGGGLGWRCYLEADVALEDSTTTRLFKGHLDSLFAGHGRLGLGVT